MSKYRDFSRRGFPHSRQVVQDMTGDVADDDYQQDRFGGWESRETSQAFVIESEAHIGAAGQKRTPKLSASFYRETISRNAVW